MSQIKIRIPDKGKPDLVGILQRANDAAPTQGRPIALIVHGVMAHKDQVYHKLLANRLASERDLDSFRYDLRAQGGESEGKWGMANFQDDADDLQVVIDYLQTEYGYRIHVIMAHSRGPSFTGLFDFPEMLDEADLSLEYTTTGSMVTGYYLSCRPHPHIPLWINISGRYNMARIMKDKRYGPNFWEEGGHDWKVKVAGKEISQRVEPGDVRAFAEWDNSFLQSSFPQDIHVLTCHGAADPLVPVEDAYTYHKIFSKRSPGTSTLSIVEGETHNWTRPFAEPVNSIMSWLEKVDGPAVGSNRSADSTSSNKARL